MTFFLIKGINPWIGSHAFFIFAPNLLNFIVAVFKSPWLVQKRFEMLPHTLKIYKSCVPFLLRNWNQNLELCNIWGQFVRETRSRRASHSSLLFSRPRLPEEGNRVINSTEPSYVTSKPPFILQIFDILLKLNFFWNLTWNFFSRQWISWNIMQRWHSCTKYVPDIPGIYWLLKVNAARQEPNTMGFRCSHKQSASPVCMWVTHALSYGI